LPRVSRPHADEDLFVIGWGSDIVVYDRANGAVAIGLCDLFDKGANAALNQGDLAGGVSEVGVTVAPAAHVHDLSMQHFPGTAKSAGQLIRELSFGGWDPALFIADEHVAADDGITHPERRIDVRLRVS
jgi:hypothetical protein